MLGIDMGIFVVTYKDLYKWFMFVGASYMFKSVCIYTHDIMIPI